jgi:hypothetical protein
MISRLRSNISRFTNQSLDYGITNYYVCEWPVPSGISQEYFNENLSQYKDLQKTFDNAFNSAGEFGLPVATAKELNKNNKDQIKKIEDANNGIINPPNNLNTISVSVTCAPPTINTFSPLTGISGTILTIVGDNLDQVTAVTINNVTTTNNITIINKFNISVVVPFSNTPVQQQNPIIVRGLKGDGISLSAFTYNPEQLTPSTPSTPPGLPPNVNTQPQQTGPLPLTSDTIYNLAGGATLLTVDVNPSAGGWDIVPNLITWNYKIVKRSVGPNNTIVETVLDQQTNTKFQYNYVSLNKQTFRITQTDVIDEIKMKTELTEPIITTSNIIYNQIMLVTTSKDKYAKFNITNNPNDVIRDVYMAFPFTMEYI